MLPHLARVAAVPLLLIVLPGACGPEPPGPGTARPDSRGRAASGAASGKSPARANANATLARLPSKFGTLLVYDDGPYRCLAFNKRSAVQSCRHRRRKLDFRYEYVPMMFAASLAHRVPKRAALLGLGGAALPHIYRAHRPEVAMDTVEIDPAVVTAATRWFGYRPRKDKGERVYTEDAARFVKRPELRGRYDLVLVDCYGRGFIPPALQTREFLAGLGRILAPGGVIVANIWQSHPRFKLMLQRYAQLYPHRWLMTGKRSGNAMLVAARRKPFRTLWTFRARAKTFAEKLRPRMGLAMFLDRMREL